METEMQIELGNVVDLDAKAPIVVRWSNKREVLAVSGFHAYARRKDGSYQEVLELYRADSDGWVQGEYQGRWATATWETKELAAKAAEKAYHRINR